VMRIQPGIVARGAAAVAAGMVLTGSSFRRCRLLWQTCRVRMESGQPVYGTGIGTVKEKRRPMPKANASSCRDVPSARTLPAARASVPRSPPEQAYRLIRFKTSEAAMETT
jgi:hypothetical protein